MICELLLSSQEPKALIPLYNYDFNVSMQAKSKNLVAHVSKYNKGLKANYKIEFMFLFVIDFTTVFLKRLHLRNYFSVAESRKSNLLCRKEKTSFFVWGLAFKQKYFSR